MQNITPNPQATEMAFQLSVIRAAVRGGYFIKKIPGLLPHPSAIDAGSPQQTARYKTYIENADFDSFPKVTLSAWLGQMDTGTTQIELPEKLEYLRDDVDNDRLSITGLIGSTAKNVLLVKWHILLTDFNGLTDTDTSNVSISDIGNLKQRATIKQYVRENVIDWDFARIDGRMQLTYLLLREIGSDLDKETMQRETVTSYLKLALDDKGSYYQQKYIDGAEHQGEMNYLMVKGKPLKFIPAEICCDEEFSSGDLPADCGQIGTIVDEAVSRYRMSAIYKEFMIALVPTMSISGMTESKWQMFKTINGRDYLASSPHDVNVLPDGVEIKVQSTDSSSDSFIKDFEMSERRARAAGAIFNGDNAVMRTATEVIEQAEKNSYRLIPIVDSIQSCLTRCIVYAGIFEGIYDQQNIENAYGDIVITMPSDFAASKITVEEAKEMRESVLSGVLSLNTYLRALKAGGWAVDDIEQEIFMLDSAPPVPRQSAV